MTPSNPKTWGEAFAEARKNSHDNILYLQMLDEWRWSRPDLNLYGGSI